VTGENSAPGPALVALSASVHQELVLGQSQLPGAVAIGEPELLDFVEQV
jgi:hypothetical protein